MSLIYKYYTNCSQTSSNSAGDNTTITTQPGQSSIPRTDYIFYLVIAVIRLCSIFLNLLALVIFIRMPHLVLRGKLLALSGSEIVLCSSSFIRRVYVLSGTISSVSLETTRFLDVMVWVNFSSIIARNWIVVLIGVSKCDAIYRPIGHTRWHEKYEKVCTGVIWSVAVAFVLFYSSLSQQQYCLDTQTKMNTTFPLGIVVLDFTSNMVYIIQAALPVICVVVTCILILVTLRRRGREHQTTFFRECNSTRISRQTDRATNMAVAIAMTFAVLELPALVTTILNTLMQTIKPVFGHTSDVCVALDSLANFFLYFGLNQRFRAHFKRLVCCCLRPKRQLETSNIALSSYQRESTCRANIRYDLQSSTFI